MKRPGVIPVFGTLNQLLPAGVGSRMGEGFLMEIEFHIVSCLGLKVCLLPNEDELEKIIFSRKGTAGQTNIKLFELIISEDS